VLFKVYDNLSVAYQDALAGDLDVLPNIATADLATAQADFSDRYLHSPSSAFQFLAFPTYDANYQNPDVRKAISMAIDRDQMVQTIFDNSQSAARSFVSPVLPGYRENTCGDACQYNPTAAKALYQAAHGPAKIQITYNADGGHQEWVEATCKQLSRNLGIACLPNPMPHFPDLLHAVQDKKPGVGMFRLGWIMDYPSMEDYLTPLYTTQGDYNYYGWSNSQFDQLVAEGSRQPSEDKAIGFYQQAENILATQLPVIPMRFGQNNTVISSRVGNVTVDAFGWVDLQAITVNGA
jgi:peptide/nickel transport system substrate-binding protein/oligopeptide transport system substrate-binding protein